MSHPEIPAPPWRRTTRATRPRTPLTQEAIVHAALRILERDGLEGFSMRSVAAELDTGPATLYWHVGSKEGLIELVVDRVFAEIELPPPDPSRWQEQLKQLAIDARAVFQRYRGVGSLTLGRIAMGPTLVRWVEWTLTLLRGARIPDRIAGYAGDLFGLYLGAIALEESMPLASPTGENMSPDQIVEMIRTYFESLPADTFPNIREITNDLISPSPDERFELGVDVILRGIASYASK